MYPSLIQFETRRLDLERELRYRREVRAVGHPLPARRRSLWPARAARALRPGS